MQKKYEAIVRAGGAMPDGTKKAQLTLCDKLIVRQVIRAAKECPQIFRVTLVSSLSVDECRFLGADVYACSGSTIVGSFLSGVRELRSGGRFIDLVGDMPFVKPEHITNFINLASQHFDSDVVLSYLSRKTSEKAFPGIHHTYAKNLINSAGQRGDYHIAGINMIDTRCIETLVREAGVLERARKDVLELACALGLSEIAWYLLGYLLGKCSIGGCYKISRGERVVSRFLGVKCVGVEISDAELGLDIDKESKKLQALQFLDRYQLV